jgi:hypothetical protein
MITVAQGDIKGKKLFLFICVSKIFWVTRGGGGEIILKAQFCTISNSGVQKLQKVDNRCLTVYKSRHLPWDYFTMKL